MAGRLQTLADRCRGRPLVALLVLCLVSVAARSAWLGDPCRSPCRASTSHLLVFDETYYVNAARVIAGIHPPAGQPYAAAPLGSDPNAEHPQLAKLVIAGSIELFGDGPFAWRLGSILFGTLAIAGMYGLVRAAGGNPGLALGAAALMAADNLLIVHGRIATLDIYVLAPMLWGAVLYLRRRPVLAGVLFGVATCMKVVGAYALLVFALWEAIGWLTARGDAGGERASRRVARFAAMLAAGVVSFFALLWVLDLIAHPYDNTAGKLLAAGPFAHLGHMISYAAGQTSPHGPQGIASYPFAWLVDSKPIVYLNINPASPSSGLAGVHPAVHFLGLISPPILLVGMLGLIGAALGLVGRRGRGHEASGAAAPRSPDATDTRLQVLALAWFLGTYVPFLLLSVIWQRTSYLYYMVIVMPGLYVAAVWLARWLPRWRWLIPAWAVTVIAAAVITYPLTPLP
jgi:4-amino-4-deoxy-L-arabinose transferase-like glycosyltransferase